MIIITYSETTADTIEDRLGKAEYSYYFIYKKYLPAMERLGTLISVTDPSVEVDKIFFENPMEECIFLSFSPPHKTRLDLKCPTVCVFAWEFSTIPYEHWNDVVEYNWAKVLHELGNALTISEYAATVVNKSIPSAINLGVLPAAVATVNTNQLVVKRKRTKMNVKATLYDSRSYNLSTDMVSDEVKGARDPLKMEPWDDQPVTLSFTENDPGSIELLVGFYSSEDWGTWSRTGSPWILLPHNIKGPVNIELELVGYGSNVGREIDVEVGGKQVSITLNSVPETYLLEFNPDKDADLLKFHKLDLAHAPGARDHRSLAIGVKSMTIRRPEGYSAMEVSTQSPFKRFASFLAGNFGKGATDLGNKLELEGIVYTTVLNPQDGRKNWEDMITAFCWAFRNEPNATLVLKMTNHNPATFLGKLLLLYSQMSPFECRVVAVHGFLTDEQYQTLMDATHYVVNSSHCEGQCLPLMEFMGQGIPAIAPDHTAMADYVDEGNSFCVKSSLYPTFWPIDERRAIRTKCYRIDWDSLRDAFLRSYDLAKTQPKAYTEMRRRSIQSIEATAGLEVVYQKMKNYFDKTARRASKDLAGN